MAGDVIDIEANEGPLKQGLRDRRRARARARTGQSEKPVSRTFWIVFGAVTVILVGRAVEHYFPRNQQAALPPPPPPEI